MKKLDQISELSWKYQGKQIKLIDMYPNQLNVIKQTLAKSNSNWFGLSRDYWMNAIKEVEISRNTVDGIFKQFKIKY